MFISEFRHQTRKSKTKTQHHGCCSILRSSFLSTKGSKYLLRSRCMLYKVINTYIHSRNPNFQISCYNYNKLIRQGKWVTQRHIGLDQPKLWNYYDLIPQWINWAPSTIKRANPFTISASRRRSACPTTTLPSSRNRRRNRRNSVRSAAARGWSGTGSGSSSVLHTHQSS